jgi:hypothetical protein
MAAPPARGLRTEGGGTVFGTGRLGFRKSPFGRMMDPGGTCACARAYAARVFRTHWVPLNFSSPVQGAARVA